MPLAEHLRPKTYWEERCQLLEESVDRLVPILAQTQPPQIQRELADHMAEWIRLIGALAAEFPPSPSSTKGS